jgi:uncharacterized membrane protein (DUF2068 family)
MSETESPATPPADTPSHRAGARERALAVIAIFEGVKGIAAIAVSLGLLELMQHDVRVLALALIGHIGMHPEQRFGAMFLHYADVLNDTSRLKVLALFWGYAAIRLAEGYGLWRDRAWAEWLAALSGALYVPIEIEHLTRRTNAINAGVLLLNIAVVAYMCYRLYRRRVEQGQRLPPPAPEKRPEPGPPRP